MGRQATGIVDVLPGFCPSIVLTEMPFQGRTLRFIEPFFVATYIDPDDNVLRAEVPELRVFAWGETLDELVYDLADEFHILWRMYVLKSDDKLSPGGLELKQKLRAILKEVADASPNTES